MGGVIGVLVSFIMGFVLITILNFILAKKSKNKIKWQHYLFGYLFILYLMIALMEVVGFPSLGQWIMRIGYGEPIFNPSINIIPFRYGVEISSVLNIIFFMPLGFLLPTLWSKYRSFWATFKYGLFFSIIIEFSQMFTGIRASDINDLIMNSLGTIIGWMIFIVMSKVFYKLASKTVVQMSKDDNKIQIEILEPYAYSIIAIVVAFFS